MNLPLLSLHNLFGTGGGIGHLGGGSRRKFDGCPLESGPSSGYKIQKNSIQYT